MLREESRGEKSADPVLRDEGIVCAHTHGQHRALGFTFCLFRCPQKHQSPKESSFLIQQKGVPRLNVSPVSPISALLKVLSLGGLDAFDRFKSNPTNLQCFQSRLSLGILFPLAAE